MTRRSSAVTRTEPAVETVFDRWNAHAGRSVEKDGRTITWRSHRRRPDGSLSPEIPTAVRRCLDGGYSVEDICGAIDNYATVLLGAEFYWSYPWALAEFLTRADGRGKAGIPKWTQFLPDNFAAERYLSRRPTEETQGSPFDEYAATEEELPALVKAAGYSTEGLE